MNCLDGLISRTSTYTGLSFGVPQSSGGTGCSTKHEFRVSYVHLPRWITRKWKISKYVRLRLD